MQRQNLPTAATVNDGFATPGQMLAPGQTPALPCRTSNTNAQRPIEHTDTVLLDVRDVDEWIGNSAAPQSKDVAPGKGRLPIKTINHLGAHQRMHAALGTASPCPT